MYNLSYQNPVVNASLNKKKVDNIFHDGHQLMLVPLSLFRLN